MKSAMLGTPNLKGASSSIAPEAEYEFHSRRPQILFRVLLHSSQQVDGGELGPVNKYKFSLFLSSEKYWLKTSQFHSDQRKMLHFDRIISEFCRISLLNKSRILSLAGTKTAWGEWVPMRIFQRVRRWQLISVVALQRATCGDTCCPENIKILQFTEMARREASKGSKVNIKVASMLSKFQILSKILYWKNEDKNIVTCALENAFLGFCL